ncbi:MAG: glycosyltransferase family 9 protein [candidate division Zixibacteria bacterium]|nr:glycosyltransferase family 9 protein [candidate division Zixibacteria bacterium]
MEPLKPVEHKIKDFAFALFRFLLKKGQKDFKPLEPLYLKKILFLRPDKIGDMIISLPVFENLKKSYPHLQLSLLCSPRNLPIVKNDPRFDKIFLYKKNIFQDIATVLAMRRENFDVVVDMISNDSITNLFLARYSVKDKPRIGVQKAKYREYYDYSYYHRLDDMRHIIRNTLELLDAFGYGSAKADGFAPPYIDKEALNKAAVFFESIDPERMNLFCVGYNLSVGNPTRLWDESNSRRLLEKILEYGQGNFHIILLTTPPDRMRGEKLLSFFEKDVFLVPPDLNLIEVSAIISKLSLLISPDTSLIHIARSFKIPVVGLYPKPVKNFLLWHPYEQKEGAVLSGNNDNIFDITVEQVFDTFLRVCQANRLVNK